MYSECLFILGLGVSQGRIGAWMGGWLVMCYMRLKM